MTDTTTPVVDPVSDDIQSGAPQGQSPLDVLDQILNDAQDKAAKEADEKAKEEERKVQEELERQKQEDARKLQEELEKLKNVTQSPEYQARVEQQQTEDQQSQDKKTAMEGLEIIQIGHTKI